MKMMALAGVVRRMGRRTVGKSGMLFPTVLDETRRARARAAVPSKVVLVWAGFLRKTLFITAVHGKEAGGVRRGRDGRHVVTVIAETVRPSTTVPLRA